MVSQIKIPVAAARLRTEKVQRGVHKAELKLHDSNIDLLELAADEVIPREHVRTCVEQSLEVEKKLHKSVNELEVVSDLLATAENEISLLHDQSKDGTMAGKRSGEGLSSVLAHIRAGRTQNERDDTDGDEKSSQPRSWKKSGNSRT
jgi:hypothetical protein